MAKQVDYPFFHSNIITGSTKGTRDEFVRNLAEAQMGPPQGTRNNVDLFEIRLREGKQSISIEEIKDLQAKLQLKPYAAKYKAGIIYDFDKATVEAQNCLLKTLEEPTVRSILYLTTSEIESLLPTITSRCRVIRLRGELSGGVGNKEKFATEIIKLLSLPVGVRLGWVEANKEAITEKETLLVLFDQWLATLHDYLRNQPEMGNYRKAASVLLNYKRDLATSSVGPRLTLETLLVSLPVV